MIFLYEGFEVVSIFGDVQIDLFYFSSELLLFEDLQWKND
jgi:hypothetical protein